ncbi:hypothetical protein MTO96_035887 [Rhipicephalus appendiculatus]
MDLTKKLRSLVGKQGQLLTQDTSSGGTITPESQAVIPRLKHHIRQQCIRRYNRPSDCSRPPHIARTQHRPIDDLLTAQRAPTSPVGSCQLTQMKKRKCCRASRPSTVHPRESLTPSDHELKKLPEELDLAAIQLVRKVLRRQLAVVSKRVSDLILQNQSWYTLELQRVTELQDSLDEACSVCIRGRKSLACSQHELTVSSLGLLAACRRRQQLLGLLRSLHLIKALQETDVRLRELLEVSVVMPFV